MGPYKGNCPTDDREIEKTESENDQVLGDWGEVMQIAVSLIRMDLTEIIHSSPDLVEMLGAINSINPSELTRNCIEGMVLDLLEELLERPLFGLIRQQGSSKWSKALLGTVKGKYLVAIPLMTLRIDVSSFLGLKDLLNIPETMFHPFVEMMVGTTLLVEPKHEISLVGCGIEPRLLEPIELFVVSDARETSRYDDFSGRKRNAQGTRDVSFQPENMIEIFSIEIGVDFGKTLFSSFYASLEDIFTLMDEHLRDREGMIVLSVPVEDERESGEVILFPAERSNELLAWR